MYVIIMSRNSQDVFVKTKTETKILFYFCPRGASTVEIKTLVSRTIAYITGRLFHELIKIE